MRKVLILVIAIIPIISIPYASTKPVNAQTAAVMSCEAGNDFIEVRYPTSIDASSTGFELTIQGGRMTGDLNSLSIYSSNEDRAIVDDEISQAGVGQIERLVTLNSQMTNSSGESHNLFNASNFPNYEQLSDALYIIDFSVRTIQNGDTIAITSYAATPNQNSGISTCPQMVITVTSTEQVDERCGGATNATFGADSEVDEEAQTVPIRGCLIENENLIVTVYDDFEAFDNGDDGYRFVESQNADETTGAFDFDFSWAGRGDNVYIAVYAKSMIDNDAPERFIVAKNIVPGVSDNGDNQTEDPDRPEGCELEDTGAPNESCLNCINQGGIWLAIGCVDPTPLGIMTRLVQTGLGVMGGVALGQLIYAGVMFQSGNEAKIAEARKKALASLGGVVVLVFSVLILRIIGVNVLDAVPGGFL